MTHEWCSGCLKLNLVWVERKVMLGEASQHVKDSAVMVFGGLFQRFTTADDNDNISDVYNPFYSTQDIMETMLKFFRS